MHSMCTSSICVTPAKNWFDGRFLTRLRNYGYALAKILAPTEANCNAVNSLDMDGLASQTLARLREVERIIGYNFNNKELLQEAFTHPSYQNSTSYKRLEYVGDSILNLLITKQQFSMYPDLSPGMLTSLRAANIDTEKLARVAVKHNHHKYIRHEKPLLRKQIDVFIKALPKYPLHSYGLIEAPKILADVVESTIGAIFIDSNSSINTTWEVAVVLLDPIITPDMLQTNPVRKLCEMCQKKGLQVRFVDRWSKEGAYEVFVDNQFRGRGEYRVKKDVALNRAAEAAYNSVVRSMVLQGSVHKLHQ